MSPIPPTLLDPNLPDTFYRGSGRLSRFRGCELPDRPEDWVASCTSRFGSPVQGLSPLPDGRLLRDAVAADPVGWLGERGSAPGVLVKLLDAGQRLPVHVHPDRAFAARHLGSPYGKTESWIVLDAAADAEVFLGFSRDVSGAELAHWVAGQDVSAMLGAMNRIPVTAGDVLLCPAGVPHAIGPDVLLLEVQEPTDFSILLERKGFPVSEETARLGLEEDLALSCVDRSGFDPAGLAQLRAGSGTSVLPAAADPFFQVTRAGDGFAGRGFAVLVVAGGEGMLSSDEGAEPVSRGSTVVVPHAAGRVRLAGAVHGYWCTAGG
jgi:mannose-6-phosphate isomerase